MARNTGKAFSITAFAFAGPGMVIVRMSGT
jgi:hypothetical protein